MTTLAGTISDKALLEIRADIERVSQCATFSLPAADVHVVGISGGNDSSATALVMAALFPNLKNLFYVFSDTGVEVDGTYEQIEKIELLTGRKVIRIAGKDNKSLFDIIEEQGNYLPSQRQRYCTRMTKIIPLKVFFEQVKAEFGQEAKIASYVGIRADESHREGGQFADGTQSYFPLQALGFKREDVYRIVNAHLGIPLFYESKSRSGCEICIFSRRSEVISRIDLSTDLIKRAANMEQLRSEDKDKLLDLPVSIGEQTGISRNWLNYAIPTTLVPANNPMEKAGRPWETFRAKADKSANLDLFGSKTGQRTFFVAVEHHIGWMGGRYETYFQKFINYSTSLGGIKTSLKFYWEHRLDTVELYGMHSEEELNKEFKIAIYEIQLDDADDLLGVDLSDTYTWQNDGQPLLLIRKTRAMLENVLLAEGLVQGLKDSRKQLQELAVEAVPKITERCGDILWAELYTTPSRADLKDDIDIDDAPVACNACAR